MKYILDAVQAKAVDDISINKTGIPSMVLMERAAMSLASEVEKHIKKTCPRHKDAKDRIKILAVCGSGNNGADAAAAARILHERGYNARIFVIKPSGSAEFESQLSIARASKIRIINKAAFDEYNIIIDGVFGIGLCRNIEGKYEQIINKINSSGAWVIAADIPSGINASTGMVMNTAVKADRTVTFGCAKLGCVLYPGREYCGKLKTADIGFPSTAVDSIKRKPFTYSSEDLSLIPVRKPHSNKGTYGKILIIAGSSSMGGAAVLSALAAYRSGAGLVRVLTHECQREPLQKLLPEAIIETYNDDADKHALEGKLADSIKWATCIVAGPGISTSGTAHILTENVLRDSRTPVILDADALNLIAADSGLKRLLATAHERGAGFILTPHLGEMSRLIRTDIKSIQTNIIDTAVSFAKKYHVICVLKDAATIVAAPKKAVYINTSGNSGMATGGSGDVLTGIIAGMSAIGLGTFEAACMGVFIHGLGGDIAADKKGKHGMKAQDIIDGVTDLMSVSDRTSASVRK